MSRPQFDNESFLVAARELALEGGPAAVTIGSVTQRLQAPTGSFYYRFASRDTLLGELWLATALAFQKEYVPAIERRDGLRAALHTPVWVRANPDDARLLLLHHRDDFVQGKWPQALKRGVAEQARRLDAAYAGFAREVFGKATAEHIRLAQFVLADVPKAAVIPHLQRRESPPLVVDELIRLTYRAVVNAWRPSRRVRAAKGKGG